MERLITVNLDKLMYVQKNIELNLLKATVK